MRETDHIPMLFGRAPNVSIAPPAELPQLFHLLVLLIQVILDRQAGGVEDADIAPQAVENA